MLLDEFSPALVAETRHPLRRADDVREEDGGQQALGLGVHGLVAQERLDLARWLVEEDSEVVLAG